MLREKKTLEKKKIASTIQKLLKTIFSASSNLRNDLFLEIALLFSKLRTENNLFMH